MVTITVERLVGSGSGEQVMFSVDSPRSGLEVSGKRCRVAGWVYVSPALLARWFDGKVYFEGAATGEVRETLRNRPRKDVGERLVKLGVAGEDTCGFAFDDRVTEDGQLFIQGAEGRLPLARITFEATDSPRQYKNAVALIGHSAVGKSAILERLNYDRARHDMDFYFLRGKRKVTVSGMLEWMEQTQQKRMFVLANDTAMLAELVDRKQRHDQAIAGIHFVFLNRSIDRFLKNITLKNTDGCFHAMRPDAENRKLYFRYLSLYAQLADDEISYPGSDLDVLTKRVEVYCRDFFAQAVAVE